MNHRTEEHLGYYKDFRLAGQFSGHEALPDHYIFRLSAMRDAGPGFTFDVTMPGAYAREQRPENPLEYAHEMTRRVARSNALKKIDEARFTDGGAFFGSKKLIVY